MKKISKITSLIATASLSAVLSVVTLFGGMSFVKASAEDIAIGGKKKTVEVTAPATYFEEWGNENATYGVSADGIWRKDSLASGGNRQIPLKDPLALSKTKDSYISFALPVYGSDGKLLADKTTAEIIFTLTNNRGEELKLKFLPGDEWHANGINYKVDYTQQNGWVNYWCSERIAGDFTADNFITLKFADRVGENIAIKKADGSWFADPNLNADKVDVAAFFNDASTLKINITYWVDNASSDTNLEAIIHDIDGTVLTTEQINEDDCFITLEEKLVDVTFNGKTVKVPSAKGTFGKNQVNATVKVVDAANKEVTLENGEFTAATGTYTITYTAQYKEKTITQEYTLTAYSGEKTMDLPADADVYFRNWISGGSYWDENGLTSIDNSGYDVEHQRQSCYQADYNIEGENMATLTVSIPIYDEEGNRLSNRLNNAENGIDYIDLMIIDADADKEFRIRMVDTYSIKEETSFYGSFYSGDPYASEANWGGWINRYADTKMKGTFTQDSSFTFRFSSKENEHFQVIAPDGTWKIVGDAEGATEETSLTKALNTFFKNVKNIRVNFYYWARPSTATENDNLAITYKNINGQSFIPVDGKIADETAPVLGSVVTPKTDVYKTGNNYVFNVSYVNEIFEDVDKRILVYRKKGTTEWNETGKLDKDSGKITGCKFDVCGTIEVAVRAADYAGNVGYSAITEISVEKGYDIVINGEVPAFGEVGKLITLPTATASDKNGTERTVTVTVEDVSGKTVEKDSENSFTPAKAGIYYVVYKSSYTDENGKTVSTKKECQITVKEATTAPDTSSSSTASSEEQGCGSLVNTACALSVMMAFACGTIIAKRKNK